MSTLLTGASVPLANTAVHGCRPTSGVASGQYTSVSTLLSSSQKFAYIGPVWWPDYEVASKTITRLQWLWGTVTKSGGSGLTVSLQDPSSSAAQLQPDGTPDQSVAIANADAGFVSNAWYRTGELSGGGRTVNRGDLVAVVLEFDGGGRISPDSIDWIIRPNVALQEFFSFAAYVVYSAGWSASVGRQPANLVFEFSDGTFGQFGGAGLVFSAISDVAYNSGSSPDEYALEFALRDSISIDGVSFMMIGGGDDVDAVLYDHNSSMLDTATVKGKNVVNTTNRYMTHALFNGAISLAGNAVYRLGIKPTTANNITIPYVDVASVDLMALQFGGPTWRLSSRTDGGAWTPVTTRRPFIFPTLSGW